jgi:uncharacterized protein YbbC (DUF1343 family)
MIRKIFPLLMAFFSLNFPVIATFGQDTPSKVPAGGRIIPAAERIPVYLPLLKNKRVAVYANQTSMVGPTHLVDTLLSLGVAIRTIFGPEHGFRGTADAGEDLATYVDKKTGITVVSLYGSKSAPSAEDLRDIDVIVFDIQDVGARFYTFISSLEKCMEAAFVNGKPMMILDRPNPNGFYVDGPVLDRKYRSFVGMQPVPVVYGMTIAEYAFMIAGERWLSPAANAKYDYYRTAKNGPDTPFHFQVIKCGNYDHRSHYRLPARPSPNLPDMQSVWCYPSTCFFEGTILSEGRGTEKPFQIFGHPSLPKDLYAFTPVSRPGARDPKLKDQLCYGWNIGGTEEEVLKKIDGRIQLHWLLDAYKLFPDKDAFFPMPRSGRYEDMWLHKLAGNDLLMSQIRDGLSEEEIRRSWEPGLTAFKAIRKKYLLYKDFE